MSQCSTSSAFYYYLPLLIRPLLIGINRSVGVVEIDHFEDVVLGLPLHHLDHQPVNIVASGARLPPPHGILAAVVGGGGRLRRTEFREQVFHILRAEKDRHVWVVKIVLIEVA